VRRRAAVTIQPGATWPDQEGTVQLPAFSWVRITNRGAAGNDLWVTMTGGSGFAALGDVPDTIVKAGTEVVQNVAGVHDSPAESLRVKNTGAAAVTAIIEIADSPIVHMTFPAS
jgi:hypothetical protein